MTHKELLNSIIKNGELVEVERLQPRYEITKFRKK